MIKHQNHTDHPTIRWKDMRGADYVRVGAGVLFVLLGIAGLVLPVLQGILFLLVAAILLGPYSRFVQKQQSRFEARFPGVAARARELLERLKQKFARRG